MSLQNRGFHLPDIAWRGYIYSITHKYGREERQAGPTNLFVFGFCRPSQAPRSYPDCIRNAGFNDSNEPQRAIVADMLMEECARAMQQRLRAAPSIKKRAKGVYSERNLGTIKDRKREKKEEEVVGDGEIIMRILWMRPGRPNMSYFVAQQLQILATMQAKQEQRQQQNRKAQRPGGAAPIPEVLL